MMKRFLRCPVLYLFVAAFAVSGLARAAAGFHDLDDGAEASGYNVSAKVSALPVQWSLARQKNGDGYYVDISKDAISLSMQKQGTKVLLAKDRDDFSASAKTPTFLVIQHQGTRWNIIWKNRVVLRAQSDQFDSGPIGWKGAAGAVSDTLMQPLGQLYFDDDFMRVSAKTAYEKAKPNPHNGMVIHSLNIKNTLWTAVSGQWKTTGIMENNTKAQVAQSANPFAFESMKKGDNLALAGRPFWFDYSFSAAVKPQGAKAVGLVLYAQDAQNYLMFWWQRNGQAQLRAVVGGKPLVLAGATAKSFGDDQWYRLKCSMRSGNWRASIDGNPVLQARTGWFGQGRVGVFSDNKDADNNAAFDDVHVRAQRDVLDDFSHLMPGRWHSLLGKWSWQNSAAPQNKKPALAVIGQNSWTKYNLDTSAFLPADGTLGLVLHHTNKGYYLFKLTGSKVHSLQAGTAQIVLQEGDKSKILASKKVGNSFDNKTTLWNFGSEKGYLHVNQSIKKTLLLDAYDTALPAGKAGIYANPGAGKAPAFHAVLVHFDSPRKVWAKVPELYEDPRQAVTMGAWSTPQGAWTPLPPDASHAPKEDTNSKDNTLWNKGLFWGNGGVTFEFPKMSSDQKLELILADAAAGQSASNSFLLELSVKGQTLSAKLFRGTKATGKPLTVATTKFKGNIEGKQLTVRRRGSFFMVSLGKSTSDTFLVKRAGANKR